MSSLQMRTSHRSNHGHYSYSLDISHGGLLNEKDISGMLKLVNDILVSTVLSQSSIRSSSSHTVRKELRRHIYMDTTHGKSIRQSLDEMGIPTLEQV